MITSLFGGILGLLYMKVSWDTISARRANKVSLGFGENDSIAAIVSAHNNFASYTPILLLLTYLAETSGDIHPISLYVIGSVFTAGRVLHYLAFRADKMNFKLRVRGMQMTLIPLVALSLINLYCFIF